jgi:hypothetical protein
MNDIEAIRDTLTEIRSEQIRISRALFGDDATHTPGVIPSLQGKADVLEKQMSRTLLLTGAALASGTIALLLAGGKAALEYIIVPALRMMS